MDAIEEPQQKTVHKSALLQKRAAVEEAFLLRPVLLRPPQQTIAAAATTRRICRRTSQNVAAIGALLYDPRNRLRLSQQKVETVVGKLNHFIVLTLYQQQHRSYIVHVYPPSFFIDLYESLTTHVIFLDLIKKDCSEILILLVLLSIKS